MQIFFSLIFVRIHTNEVIHIIVRIRIRCGFCTNSYNVLYELYSTNSYKVWFLYQFIQFLYELYSTNSYNEPRAGAARAKPEHDQAAPSCPDVRVHPAAPTFRVHPAAPTLGYTRLPRPVRVRSWGGWVRNGIKITIRKSGLYDFIQMAYSQPLCKST
jgi:hypothetical protein